MTHHHHDSGYLERLRQFDHVLEPMHRRIVQWFDVAPGSAVLDAGCGGGGVTMLLAEAGGQVTALDVETELLAALKELMAGKPFASRIACQEGSIESLPFPDGAFDLVWCSRVIHHMRDQVAAAREIRRVLKPGGKFALREDGFLTQLLPFDIGLGEPGFEMRWNVAHTWEFAQVRPSIPDYVRYPFGWTQLLRDAGFADVTARSFVFETLPPFSDDLGAFVVRHLRRPLEEPEIKARLSPEDQATLERLVDPQSPHFVLKRPDLYYVRVSTVYVGQA